LKERNHLGDLGIDGRRYVTLCKKLVFYGEELLAPCPTPKLNNHPLSAVRNCLFNIFEATLHIWEAVSSIHNQKMRHAAVTGTFIIWRQWKENIEIDLKIYEGVDWIKLAQYISQRRDLVITVMKFRVL
jgi:hypothetical protein